MRANQDAFAAKLRAMGVPLGQKLGSAEWGAAFLHASNPRRVVKVTQMLREAESVQWVKSKQKGFTEPAHTCLPIIYGIVQGSDSALVHPKGAHSDFWIIEREELHDFDLPAWLGLPPVSSADRVFWNRLMKSIFDVVQQVTVAGYSRTVQQPGDGELLARMLIERAYSETVLNAWESAQTERDIQYAELTDKLIEATRVLFQAQVDRLAKFTTFCLRHQRILGDMNHWNWGLRGVNLVVRDLGGFLHEQFAAGPFEGLGAWSPKVIHGERDGHWLARRVPDSGEDLQEFRMGFEAGLDRRAAEMDLGESPRVWRTGYAVGRESRGNAKQIAMVYEIIRQRIAALTIPPPTRTVRRRSGTTGIGAVFRTFARTAKKAKSGSVSTDGTSLFSYGTLIMQKRMQDSLDNVVYVTKSKRSKTTARHISLAKIAMTEAGWKIVEVDFP